MRTDNDSYQESYPTFHEGLAHTRIWPSRKYDLRNNSKALPGRGRSPRQEFMQRALDRGTRGSEPARVHYPNLYLSLLGQTWLVRF